MVLADAAFVATAGCLCADVDEEVFTAGWPLCGLAGVAASEEQARAESASAGRIDLNTTLFLNTALYCRTLGPAAGYERLEVENADAEVLAHV